MLDNVDENSWSGFLETVALKTIRQTPGFMNAVARSKNSKPVYHIWRNVDGSAIIGFAAFSRWKRLTQPFYSLYHDILIAREWESIDLTDEFQKFFTALKSEYLYIRLKMSPNFKYTRAIELSGLSAKWRQTYVKNLRDLSYSRNINRIVKRAAEKNYRFQGASEAEATLGEIITDNCRYWSYLKQKKNKALLYSLFAANFIEVYELWDTSRKIGAICVFTDDLARQVQTMFVSRRSEECLEAHTFLYHSVMTEFQRKGYSSCDFLGANIANIARYKAKFKGELVKYYDIEFSRGVYTTVKVLKKLR